MKKRTIRGIIGLIAIVLVAVLAVYLSRNAITGAVIEHEAAQATGTKAVLKSAELEPMAGSVEIRGLTIANPSGFKADGPFMQLHQARAEFSTGSLLSGPIDVRKLTLDHLHLDIEQADSHTNVQAILKHLRQNAGGKKARKYIIHQLDITHITVTLHGFGGGGQTLHLPDLHEKNIGNAKGAHGLRLPDLTGIIVKMALHAVGGKITDLPNAVLHTLKGSAGSVGDLFTHTLKSLVGGTTQPVDKGQGRMDGGAGG